MTIASSHARFADQHEQETTISRNRHQIQQGQVLDLKHCKASDKEISRDFPRHLRRVRHLRDASYHLQQAWALEIRVTAARPKEDLSVREGGVHDVVQQVARFQACNRRLRHRCHIEVRKLLL